MNDKDLIEIGNAIDNFKNVIIRNIDKSLEKKRIGFVSISIKTKISGSLKAHIFILILPFVDDCISKYISEFFGKYKSLHLEQFSLNINKSFYKFVYEEMEKTKFLPIVNLNHDFTWNMNNHFLFIHTKNNNNTDDITTFNEWYKNNGFFEIQKFELTIINPDTYCVPFPLNNFHFKCNSSGDYLKLIKD